LLSDLRTYNCGFRIVKMEEEKKNRIGEEYVKKEEG
jgi:hypothetical protein